MGYKEANKAIAVMFEKCYESGWTFQFAQVDGTHVKVTAFDEGEYGLSMVVDVDATTVEQIAYMTRKLIEEVEKLGKEKSTGKNRTLPA